MSLLRTHEELQNEYEEISDLCHMSQEPVFITKDGEIELVVMSIELYNQVVGKLSTSEEYDAEEDGKDECPFH